MWASVSASVVGTSHVGIGLPCQDACSVLRTRITDREFFLAAVADGAGSASRSDVGSAEAVQRLLQIAAGALTSTNPCDITAAVVAAWYGEVLEHLRCVAGRESVGIGDLACTLLFALAWDSGAIFAQVGDGAWVIEKHGILAVATWPDTGEYANVTTFLTTKGALERLQFSKIDGGLAAIAGFTDGIQSLTLDYSLRIPSARFFNAMFNAVRTTADETELIAPLKEMLGSELITSRTDDDKTLVVAVRRKLDPPAEPQLTLELSQQTDGIA